ncbi:MAG: NADH-quinone oxidoreductase subunit N [Chlamydiales bacterium]|jgi:NADH-quinone oxidoreductase subunit N
MNAESLQGFFNDAFLTGVSPMLTLTVGVLLLLLIEIFPQGDKLRPIVFVATLLSAFWGEVLISRDPIGPILGGTYAADSASAYWGMIFLASTLIAWIFGRRYYKTDRKFLGEHDVLMLCTPIGMMLMAGAEDLIVFFVGLELLSIPLYCLASFQRARDRSVEAGLKYFVLGAFAAALFLYGAALTYMDSGTLSMIELRELGIHSTLGLTGVGLMLASLFFKVSVFPFHLWVPDVYQGSPTPVTTLMATGTKAAGFAFLLKLIFLLPSGAAPVIAAIAVITMAVGNLGALVQEDVKRMLAYSGIAHAGTLLLVVAGALAGDPEGQSTGAALYYMAAYVFTAGGAFGLLSWLEADGEHFTKLESLRGLAGRRPGIAAALTLFMLSLGGIPATGGFLGKWFVFSVAVRSGLTGFAIVGALLSVVALGYYLRVIVAMYMQPEIEGQAPPMTRRMSASLATGLCVAMVLALGLLPGFFIG